MSLTTEKAIRNLTASLVAGTTPAVLAGTKFVEHRYDEDFEIWVGQNPDSCFRRFSVRDTLFESEPEVTNTTEEWRTVMLDLIVAYPKSNRAGSAGARNMDEAIRSDMTLLEKAVGLNGASNYSTIAAFLKDRASTSIERRDAVTLVRTVLPYGFYRSTP